MSVYIFWSSLAFIVYTYFGYPILIWLLSRTRKITSVDINDEFTWPEISIVIPVYNEKNNINKKIENLLSLDYPSDKLTIVLVSDGSDDGTEEFYSTDDRIIFISYKERQGKPTALNLAVEKITTEIVVFTDIRQTLDSKALKYLVKRLVSPKIGAVSGELCHQESASNVGKNVGLYWLYEKWIRKSESRFNSTAGVTGALYAIHTKNYHQLRKDTLLDDFEVPMHILKKKLRVVLESQAKIYDASQEDIVGEKNRKIRTLTGNFQSFVWNKWLFIPWENPIIFQFLSHKVFRLLVPYAMLATLISSYVANEVFYIVMFGGQVLFYLVGYLGGVSKKLRNIKFISIIVVFIGLNVSAVMALKQFLNGKVKVQWDKTS
ncbi:MAG: glycosyltransferase family 2 protein [Thiohalomonadales bacterium]